MQNKEGGGEANFDISFWKEFVSGRHIKLQPAPLQSTLENQFSHDFRGPHNLSFTSTLCTQQAPSYAC